ncbi:MAG: amino acid adenylation domain-containing protein [Gemmataceae bacterium]|nr:amino acid adenylation domain-containing protein [Gemmataceae bacterium]
MTRPPSTEPPHAAAPVGKNGTAPAAPSSVRDLLAGFLRSASQHPHLPAVQCGSETVSYGELLRRADGVARWLRGRGVGPDAPVAFCLDKSVDAYVTLLGILRAGGGYVPIDPHYPADRITTMLEDARPAFIVTSESYRSRFTVPVVTPAEMTAADSSAIAETVGDEFLGYILFTSGSTGRPKGVAMPRGALRRLIDWQVGQSPAGPGDVTLQFASLSFDVSFQEIFSTWATAGTLVAPTEAERRDPAALVRLIDRVEARRLFVPFVMLQHLAEAAGSGAGCLREVITAGEQLQITPAVRQFFADRPGCSLHNHYGPTEAHVVTAHTLAGPPEQWPALPPIGRPIDSARIYLVDEHGHEAPEGEIWIGGECLARGYLGKPELTAERFRPDPFHAGGRVYTTGDLGRWNSAGSLEFLGRRDQQVKIRGFRVEPGEIESVMCGHPGVAAAAVVARETAPGERKLIAYFESKGPADDLREYLLARLPDYMVPAQFVALPALPKTPSGKVDRQALPAPAPGRPALAVPFVAPRSATEAALAGVWERVLDVSPIGIDDGFFDLGGHSLALARVHARLRETVGRDVAIAELFQYPTIRKLAAALDGETTTAGDATRKRPTADEPIAIIGFAGRFPGAANVDQFWANLVAGVESITRFSDEELLAAGIPESLVRNPDYAKSRGILPEADRFDAGFFGLPPREAELTDPQQRVFLETAWTALEHAGYVPERCRGRVGVFAGASMNTYLLNSVLADPVAARAFLQEFQSGGYPILVGNDKDYLATRVAFKLNLRGPAVSVQTACSTSLVAACTAVENLRAGTCDMALAGGVSVTFPQVRGSLYQEGAITSPDGHCRPFDADAHGTVFGEGAGVVVLKRLADAVADRDTVYAVIRGIGLSNDGADKLSFLAPGLAGQAEAVRAALDQAGFDPKTVGFIEAHGTGTPMGDPIEVAALAQVFRGVERGSCRLGSVKANIGHLEAAAGVTGLIKAALALHHRQVPGTVHFRQPHPAIGIEQTPFRIPAATEDWPSQTQRRAGVTSLGVGGTNAHVSLEEAPTAPATGPAWKDQLYVLSARSPEALHRTGDALADHLNHHSELPAADVAYTLQVGRRAFAYRRAVVAGSTADAAVALRKPADVTKSVAGDLPVAWLFPGQGAQAVGMGRGLYEAEPTFRAPFDLCADLLKRHLGFDLRDVVFGSDAERLQQTAITQPALFAVEYSLAQMWLGWGVTPKAMFGHSIGEFAAACVAGVFSLDDALLLVARRGALIQACPPGVMLALRASEDATRAILPPGLDVAAINGPTQTVVSGSADAIAAWEPTLAEKGIQSKRLVTSHGFHSASLDPAVAGFREVVRAITLHPPKIPFISSVTGTWIEPAQATDPEYWATQLRKPVRCLDALRTISGSGDVALLEVGPGATLVNLSRGAGGTPAATVPGLPSDEPAAADLPAVLGAMGRLWTHGVSIDWDRFHALSPRQRVGLPGYSFDRTRYWINPPGAITAPEAPAPQPIVQRQTGSLLPDVRTLFAELAGVEISALDADTSFYDVGFDSLLLTQAAQAIQTRFGIRVAFRQLLDDLSTPGALARWLEQQAPAPAAVPAELPPPPPKVDAPAGFGAFVPIDPAEATDWSPRQLDFLRRFVARFAAKTAKSKGHVQEYRKVHADPRTVSGFTKLWKEIVYPIVVNRSAGASLWDIDGNEYIDLLNGFGPDLLGHSPPFVTAAVEKQLRAGYEVGPTPPQAGELARLICEMTGLERASFVCTGSEAVQAALRAARTVTGRDKVVTFARDYHGNFDEVLLRPTAGDGTRAAMPSAPGVPRTAVGNVIVLDYGSPDALEVIRRLAPELAAVLIEPVQSRRPEWRPTEFVREVRKITREAGAAFIFDEVITGFRLHPGGAQTYYGVEADLVTFGKVVGGGMPIGVVAGRGGWMDCFDGGWWQYGDGSIPEAGRTFFAGTFVRHPLALAAGIAALNHLREQGPALQERLNARADRFVAELNAVARSNAVPLEIVNCGSLMFFRNVGGSKEASLLFYLLRERGIFILEGFPSYLNTAHTDADLARVAAGFRDAVAEMRANGFFAGGVVESPTPTAAGLVPLTEAQRELWLAAQSGDDASRAFNETCTLRIRGPFDLPRFRRAVADLVARHDALRSVFDPSGGGQQFESSFPVEVVVHEWSSSADPEARLTELQDSADRAPFDLAAGPLLRVNIVRLAAEDHAVILTAHHIACDGWSYDVILHDLGTLYSGGTPDAAASFASYAKSRAGRPAPDLPWWKARFAPVPVPVDLPTDHARPAQRTFRGNRQTRRLGPTLSDKLRRAAARLNCTPYALMLAGYQSLLYRMTGQNDLVVGIPTAGQSQAGLPSLVGHCVHFLPLRQGVRGDQPFAEFAASVKKNLLDAFDHQDFTYVSLLRALPELEADRPLVSVGFNLDPALGDLGFAGLNVTVEKNPKHFVNLELHWNVVDEVSEFVVEAEFNTDLFADETVTLWLGYYAELLAAAADRPETPLNELAVLTGEQRRKMLVDWNATARPVPATSVVELFARQVEARPDSPAVVAGGVAYSYDELNRRANRLAHRLIELGVSPDKPVAVLLPRSADLVVALLGILKAGGAYLPLDPNHPTARNVELVSSAAAVCVVAEGPADLGIPVVSIHGPFTGPDTDPAVTNTPTDLFAVLYTSGSTGKPKGVMVTHAGVIRLLFGAGYCDFGPDHTHALIAPVSFDAATFEIWGALLHGGRLAVYPDALPDAHALGQFLTTHQVDTLWLTAGLFNAVVDQHISGLVGVRQLLTGGEALSVPHVRRALAELPGMTLINGYGPTEVTTFACTYKIPRDLPELGQGVPIGRPIGNTTALVLDASGRPVPIGVVGELYLGGMGVARGYLGQPALTAERFVDSPVPEVPGPLYKTGDRVRWRPDGLLEFFGRADRQIKIRGHRIEPGEIETVIAGLPGVTSAVVDVTGSGVDARLVAYAVAPGLTGDAIRAALAERLPGYLVPQQIAVLDSLPLTPQGKLNRAALPAFDAVVADSTPRDRIGPRTDAEYDILRVWCDVLRNPDISVTDDFFALGGHSLTAVELVAAIRDRLGHQVPLGVLYQAPTVEKFAAIIQDRLEAGSDRSLVPLHEAGTRPPLFLVAGVGGHVFAFHKFARLLGPDQPCYGVKAIGVDGARPTPERIEDIAAEYVEEIVAARPSGPIALGGYSIGAVVAFEVALQLRARGREVPLLVAFDASAPGYMNFTLTKRLRLHLANLIVRGGGWSYLRQRFVNLRDKFNWAAGRGHRNAPEVPGLTMFSQDAITRVWVALHKAYKVYKPARLFDGEILVIRADIVEDWDKYVSHDPNIGWAKWTTGTIRSHGLKAQHLDLFHEPTIYDVARLVGAEIPGPGQASIGVTQSAAS